MNSDELWETTLDPSRRNLIQVLVEDVEKADRNNESLFNGSSKYADERKVFLLKNQHKVTRLELDI
jgi:DNA gyrase/topoisomerase IV subunit B